MCPTHVGFLAASIFAHDVEQVWDGISDARISFSSFSASLPEMARLMENVNLQRALLRRIDELSSTRIHLLDNVKVDSIIREETETSIGGWPIIVLSNGQRIRARLLVMILCPTFPFKVVLMIPLGRR